MNKKLASLLFLLLTLILVAGIIMNFALAFQGMANAGLLAATSLWIAGAMISGTCAVLLWRQK